MMTFFFFLVPSKLSLSDNIHFVHPRKSGRVFFILFFFASFHMRRTSLERLQSTLCSFSYYFCLFNLFSAVFFSLPPFAWGIFSSCFSKSKIHQLDKSKKVTSITNRFILLALLELLFLLPFPALL